ncbi:ATP-binding protein [Thiotrichales bacterium 19S9-12]|nr:ATP-binding protein [Thiotrichales bacterium 19S9-11]MCF6811393.1 ATP-binding protein [Thiotrichales bacterium 19S9-12]
MKIKRILNLNTLLEKKSFFLFGPRATGKSTLINDQIPDKYLVINLLRNEYFMELLQSPQSLESMINAISDDTIVVIDEIQRVPALLNEVHRLIEERGIHFLLTGSSARKLKQKYTNLLAGRARKAELFPLVSYEIPDFNLNRYLQFGGLPMVYLSDEPYEELQAYVDMYMKDEIQAEALVRNIPGFSQFLKMAALTNGKMLNFTSIASDSGLPVSTVREYYFILEDTFLGFMLNPYTHTVKRKAISTAKFYFFDLGVVNYLSKISQLPPQSELYGDKLEHFIALEIRAYLSYRRINQSLYYWRSKSGMEVDFIIGDDVALEVKATKRVQDKHLKGLYAFKDERIAKRYLVVSLDPIAKVLPSGIELYPLDKFLSDLWSDKIIK